MANGLAAEVVDLKYAYTARHLSGPGVHKGTAAVCEVSAGNGCRLGPVTSQQIPVNGDVASGVSTVLVQDRVGAVDSKTEPAEPAAWCWCRTLVTRRATNADERPLPVARCPAVGERAARPIFASGRQVSVVPRRAVPVADWTYGALSAAPCR